jgi:branched-chain amino acid transport system substrate-binding protein
MLRVRVSTLILAVLVGAACGNSNATNSSGGSNKAAYSVTIGTDLSGPFSASSGIPQTEGFLAYIAHLNSTGGVNGHKINVPVLDDRSDVQTGLANYQNALSSDSLGLLMEQASAIAGPVAAKAINDHIVVSNNTEYMGGGVFPYVYDVYPSADLYAKTLATFSSSLVKASSPKVAILHFDTPAQRSGFEPKFEAAYKANGWSIAYSQFVPIATIDFSVSAGAIASLKPDLIATNLLDSQLGQFVSAVRSRGLMVPIVNTVAIITDASLAKINDSSVYLLQFTASTNDSSNPSVNAIRALAKESGHTRGSDNGLYILGYVYAQVIAAAIGKCGDACTREKFNAALEQTDVDTNGLMAGRPGYTKTDHTMPKKLAVVKLDPAKGIPMPSAGFGFDK